MFSMMSLRYVDCWEKVKVNNVEQNSVSCFIYKDVNHCLEAIENLKVISKKSGALPQ